MLIFSVKGKGKNSNGGDIYIYADKKSSFKKGGFIDIGGGEISGAGGFVELSAGEEVALEGGVFNTYSFDENHGSVLIDPDDITITSNLLTSGGNYTLSADVEIIIASGVLMSTRNIGRGTDHENGPSRGNSGSLSLAAPSIVLEDTSKIFTHATGSYLPGGISMEATSSKGTSISVGNATIRGGDMNFLAQSDTDRTLQGSNPISTAGAEISFASGARVKSSGNISVKANAKQGVPIFNNGLFDARDAKAKLTLNGATFESEGNILLSSSSQMMTDLGPWLSKISSFLGDLGNPFSFMVATTDSIAETKILGSTSITAGGTVDINSSAHTQVHSCFEGDFSSCNSDSGYF